MSYEPYLSEITLFPYSLVPRGYAHCNGALMNVAQNQALFSLLGTTYGGDGRTTFALPNLQGRAAMGFGQGPGFQSYAQGTVAGTEGVPLSSTQMPMHTHALNADAGTAGSGNTNAPAATLVLGQSAGQAPSGAFGLAVYGDAANLTPAASSSVSSVGAGQPHENRQPFLALNMAIAVQGIFPTRN